MQNFPKTGIRIYILCAVLMVTSLVGAGLTKSDLESSLPFFLQTAGIIFGGFAALLTAMSRTD